MDGELSKRASDALDAVWLLRDQVRAAQRNGRRIVKPLKDLKVRRNWSQIAKHLEEAGDETLAGMRKARRSLAEVVRRLVEALWPSVDVDQFLPASLHRPAVRRQKAVIKRRAAAAMGKTARKPARRQRRAPRQSKK